MITAIIHAFRIAEIRAFRTSHSEGWRRHYEFRWAYQQLDIPIDDLPLWLGD